MKPPRGALSRAECKAPPKTTKVYWPERPIGETCFTVFSKAIIWSEGPYGHEYHVNFDYPVYFFLNYWDAYAHCTKINAGIDIPWVPHWVRRS